MKKLLLLVAILAAGLFLTPSVLSAQIYVAKVACKPWYLTGDLNGYRFGLDKSVYKKGSNNAFLKSTDMKKTGPIWLTQTCLADDYLGKRIKMTAYIKSINVSGKAGISLKVYSKERDYILNSDSTQVNNPITGTMDWTKSEIVLDITEDSGIFIFGVWFDGTGKIWIDNISFEVVDKMETEITGEATNVRLPANPKVWGINKRPTNLDFKLK